MMIRKFTIALAMSDFASRFIGLSGGQIFHEMMLRHNVKHICMFICTTIF